MIGSRKAILVVDDSEIDRIILRNILSDDFEVLEAYNGKVALDVILDKMNYLDAILLDVSMPLMDGFSVLQFMKNKKIGNIPVFLVTAEATRDNVEKAARYNVSEFIGKPFKREEILKRLKSRLKVDEAQELTRKDLEETNRYIASLKAVYDEYLANFGKDQRHYERVSDLMKMLLEKSVFISKENALKEEQIEVISKAAYFCDIGYMLIPPEAHDEKREKPDERTEELYQKHTVLGADFVALNSLDHCQYFVRMCKDICSHHHERYDGTGFPYGLTGKRNTLYAQLCGLLDRFDRQFCQYQKHNELQFDFCIRTFAQDPDAFSSEVFALLNSSRNSIVTYYQEYCL